jgi:hypothetical protein
VVNYLFDQILLDLFGLMLLGEIQLQRMMMRDSFRRYIAAACLLMHIKRNSLNEFIVVVLNQMTHYLFYQIGIKFTVDFFVVCRSKKNIRVTWKRSIELKPSSCCQ